MRAQRASACREALRPAHRTNRRTGSLDSVRTAQRASCDSAPLLCSSVCWRPPLFIRALDNPHTASSPHWLAVQPAPCRAATLARRPPWRSAHALQTPRALRPAQPCSGQLFAKPRCGVVGVLHSLLVGRALVHRLGLLFGQHGLSGAALCAAQAKAVDERAAHMQRAKDAAIPGAAARAAGCPGGRGGRRARGTPNTSGARRRQPTQQRGSAHEQWAPSSTLCTSVSRDRAKSYFRLMHFAVRRAAWQRACLHACKALHATQTPMQGSVYSPARPCVDAPAC